MNLKEWLALLEEINFRYVTSGFDLVDAICAGKEKFGDEALQAAAAYLRKSYWTIYNWWSLTNNPAYALAKQLNATHENYNLTISHVAAVRSLSPENAMTYLTRAGEQGWSEEFTYGQVQEFKSARAKDTAKPTGSAPLKGSDAMDKTYHMEIQTPTAPVSAPQALSGAVAVHRNWTPDDEVSFTEPELYVDEADTPFEVAERIVDRWGVPFAKQVADEIFRWGEWT